MEILELLQLYFYILKGKTPVLYAAVHMINLNLNLLESGVKEYVNPNLFAKDFSVVHSKSTNYVM